MEASQIFMALTITVYAINLLLIISLIFLERKEVRSIFPWLFGFIAVPIVSWILYFFIGKGPKLNRRKWSKRKKIADRALETQFLSGKLTHYQALDPEVSELIKLNDNNGLPCTMNNDVTIYTDAHKMYEDQLREMAGATSSINVMYYLFKPDEAGRAFLEVMTAKAKEGLSVVLVFDDSANPKTGKKFLKKFMAAGGHVQPFFPSHLTLINHNFAYRNHRKIVVIDGRIGYLGGMNVGVDYLSLDPKIHPWRDTHLRIVGEAVALLQTRFLQDYSCADKKPISPARLKSLYADGERLFPNPLKARFSPVQILSSGPDSPNEEIKQAYLKMIQICHRTLYLETPYFIPDKSFVDALIIAKKSGVEIKLVIPGVPDKKSVYHVTFSYLEEVLKAGIQVYLYPGFIHSKMLVSDDRVASIGTANMDVRSFVLNFEVNALIYDRVKVQEAVSIAESDIARSKELTYEDYCHRSLFDKIKEDIFRLFSPLM